MLNLYRAIISPHLEYAGTLVNSLDQFQHLTLQTAIGAMKTTPIQFLNYETIESLLYLRKLYLA